jgi:hypothetical protein
MAFDPNDEADKKILKDALEAAVAEQVTGLKNKNGELIAEEKRLKDKLRQIEESLGGVDVPQLKELQKKLLENEELRLLAEGKTSEVIERRTATMRDDHAKQLKKVEDERDANARLASRYKASTLANAIRKAAQDAGVEATAIDDVVLRASAANWTVDDDGNAVQLDAKGDPVLGKDAKTPFQPSEWVEALKEKAPHFWPKAAGGNAGGGGKATDKKWADLTGPEKAKLQQDNPTEYQRLLDAHKGGQKIKTPTI